MIQNLTFAFFIAIFKYHFIVKGVSDEEKEKIIQNSHILPIFSLETVISMQDLSKSFSFSMGPIVYISLYNFVTLLYKPHLFMACNYSSAIFVGLWKERQQIYSPGNDSPGRHKL